MFIEAIHFGQTEIDYIIGLSTYQNNTYKSPLLKPFNVNGSGGASWATYISDFGESGSTFTQLTETYRQILERNDDLTPFFSQWLDTLSIAYFPLDEASGTVAVDASGNLPDAPDGTTPPTKNVTTGITIGGVAQKGYTFDDRFELMDLYSTALYDLVAAGVFHEGVSIMEWVEPGSGFWSTAGRRSFVIRANTTNGIAGEVKASGKYELIWTGNGNTVSIPTTIGSGTTPFHILMSVDASASPVTTGVKVYYNGTTLLGQGDAYPWTDLTLESSRVALNNTIAPGGGGGLVNQNKAHFRIMRMKNPSQMMRELLAGLLL